MSRYEWVQRFKTRFALLTGLYNTNWEVVAESVFTSFLGDQWPEQAAVAWKDQCDFEANMNDCQVPDA